MPLVSPDRIKRDSRARRANFALTLVTLAACWGCGAGAVAPPALLAVKGKVTYRGQPLTKGIVRFEPDGYGRMAVGNLQSDGSFVLTTFHEADGVVPGHHRVFITDVESKLARDRAFRKYTTAKSELQADVDAENTEFTFNIP